MVHNRINRNSITKGLTFWGQWAIAITSVNALLFALALYQTGEVDARYRVLAVLTFLGSVPSYSLLQVYHKRHGYLTGLGRLLLGWLLTLAGLTSIGFLSKTGELFSREIILIWAVAGYCLQALLYLPLHGFSRHYHRQMHSQYNTLIIGTDRLAVKLADTLAKTEYPPLVGLISSSPNELSTSISAHRIVGPLQELRELIRAHDIRRLYIALSLSEAKQVEALYIDLLDSNVDVVWVPDLGSMTLLNHSVSELDGLPAIHLNESPLTSYPTAALSKTLLDRSLAALAIIGFSPLLLVIAVAVKVSSPGPIIFKQERHGWNGKIIKVWKFRSMRLHDDHQVQQAGRQDPRITPIGRFIRRTSIDELPQFFNVLQGHMALVGPRPHAIAHNDYYTGKIRAYMARHRIKPGITGLAQISGCRGETETLDKMQKRVEIDLNYINNWSLWLDIKILIKTPFTLFSKDIY
ncbi:undecaprenyl-phosphate glucose phosphotransferase [Pseudomonas sp. 6D_7.1_Bac1]|uniref:undecaprenyl-phosphate glucose phosphotransferase n=1 Tax=Pseudomonas sp. 6D_7.1_Bac1 TaxID=2971615 RepID=UPI0021CA4611|nr:undecaprenyl-phosphate glucose phosphotransferase [Pseudomonas sp. 6D_7.1_Bac1]MCU1753115.1 undecaprenyl-phosphate glucose phosphotransferase [Pseudomonas sp. 6D_7.1_Bac1]